MFFVFLVIVLFLGVVAYQYITLVLLNFYVNES